MASRVVSPGHPEYPSGLVDLVVEGDPPELFVRGPLGGGPGVALVGSREATSQALALARAMAADLAAAGWVIWSGGARGVDAAAHRGALDAGGRTVLCAPSGLDHPYPREHAELYAAVLDAGGALLSRVADRARPSPGSFHARNHVLAAATRGVVVVEARLEGGARSTAASARRLGRRLCVVPHAPWSEPGAGCARELADGGALAVTCAADVLAALDAPPGEAPRRPPRPPRNRRRPSLPLTFEAPAAPVVELSEGERALVDALGGEALHLDDLCERARLSPGAALHLLLTLTLRGVVEERSPHVYGRATW